MPKQEIYLNILLLGFYQIKIQSETAKISAINTLSILYYH